MYTPCRAMCFIVDTGGVVASGVAMHVGLIEDDPIFAEQFQEASEQAQLSCSRAHSLTAGLQAFAHVPLDAMVLNLMLGDSKGIETYRSVRKAFPRLPIVIWTQLNDLPTAQYLMASGADSVVFKVPAEVEPIIREVLFACERRKFVNEPQSFIGERLVSLERTVEGLQKTVQIGNGTGSLVTRVTVIENLLETHTEILTGRLEGIQNDIAQLTMALNLRVTAGIAGKWALRAAVITSVLGLLGVISTWVWPLIIKKP